MGHENADNPGRNTFAMADVIVKAMDRTLSKNEGRPALSGVASGFRDLDEITDGFRESQLVVIGGRPSMGTTALALNICEHNLCEANRLVLYVSLDQSALDLMDRLLASRAEVVWHDQAPPGNLDLLVTLDFRLSTTCVYSDIVLPTATWYEKNDLNTSDMHPFIHPLTSAVDPVWEARNDWDIYKGIAKAFSAVASEVLGVEKAVVLTPIMHDSPGEIAQHQAICSAR